MHASMFNDVGKGCGNVVAAVVVVLLVVGFALGWFIRG